MRSGEYTCKQAAYAFLPRMAGQVPNGWKIPASSVFFRQRTFLWQVTRIFLLVLISHCACRGRLRALCRLVAVALHIVRGLFIVYWRMPAMSRQQRQMQVQRWSARLLRHCGVGL